MTDIIYIKPRFSWLRWIKDIFTETFTHEEGFMEEYKKRVEKKLKMEET